MDTRLRRGALLLASLALLATVPVLASARPAPTPVWGSSIASPRRLTPGSATTFTYAATTTDTLVLTVAIRQLPPSLRLLRTGSTGYMLTGQSPTWTLLFAAGPESTKRLVWRFRVAGSARPGSALCFTVRQVARGAGGPPDVVSERVCTAVARA
jgi:hypothetical protein